MAGRVTVPGDTVIVDASVWIQYFNGPPTPETIWLRENLGRCSIALTDLLLCEVLQGVRDEKTAQALLKALAPFRIYTGNLPIAVQAAANYRALRRRGITVRSTVDSLTATFCIQHGYPLLHRDRDFDPFEVHLGLLVVHP